MKFTAARDGLKARVDWIAKASTARGGDVVLVKLTTEGDRLFLEGSDGTFWRKTEMPLTGDENVDGTIFTPIGQLSRVLTPGSAPLATLSADDDSREVTINVGRSEFRLGLAIEPQGWEQMPEFTPIATAKKDQVLWALRTAASGAAANSDKGKAAFLGVEFVIEAERIIFSSTNGYRMIRTCVQAQGIAPTEIISLPAPLVDAILAIEGNDVTFVLTEQNLFGVADSKTSAVSLRMDVQHPPIRKLLDQGLKIVEGTTLDSSEFVEALQIVDATGLPHVKIATDDGEMVITSQAPTHDSRSDARSETTIPMIGDPGLGLVMATSLVKPLFSALRTDSLVIKRAPSEGTKTNPVFVYEDSPRDDGTSYEACFMPIADVRRAA
ncbi:hypothetical protein GCM10025867_46880 (plasmid) [Frondihabitans sucicola]|uniref:DNA polymerase III subunit beta n=1 Tax=Frondihabitans sucicola TaxID=1268041 RepID=A0ABM8GVF0_9MICO|nr:hypothetical protein [Frondihabitans sucicola]BDZ52447.1 hypothetical protein GCM10025867_46880 [Frondihabitans sucicola]